MEYALPAMKILTAVSIGTIVLGVLLFLGVAWGKKGPLSYIFGGIFCIALGIFLYFLRTPGKVSVEEGYLSLKVPLCSEKVIGADDVERAWIEDITSDSPWRPVKKRSGSAMGNIRTGWFTLQNGKKAFLVLEDSRAVCIETVDGEVYLIGIPQFDRFVRIFSEQIWDLSAEPEGEKEAWTEHVLRAKPCLSPV